MKSKIVLGLIVFSVLVLPTIGFSQSLGLTGNYHIENRQSTSQNNTDFYLSYDYALISLLDLHAGVRLGMYRENLLTNSVTTNNRFFGGVQAYKLLMVFPMIYIKLGAAIDVLSGNDIDPVWVYGGALTGVRLGLPGPLFAEVPVEIGTFPFFDDREVFFRFGLQVGYNF
jgi:hypothetical protein